MSVLQGLIGHGSQLFAAWKGEPGDDRIFFSSWEGSGNWKAAITVPGNTSAGSALGIFNGTLYAAWKGESSDPRLFYAHYDGQNWQPQAQIPNAYSDTGPAICQFGSNLIAAWKDLFGDGLFYASYDGHQWTTPVLISGVGSSVGPSLATYNGSLYAAWKGAGSDPGLYYAFYDNHGWQSQNNISGVASSVGPALAGIGNSLYAVWKGEGSDQALYYSWFDGTKWQPQAKIAGANSSVGAAIAEYQGKLYAMFRGANTDASLYLTVLDGHWTTPVKTIPGNTGPDDEGAALTVPSGFPSGPANYWFVDAADRGKSLTGATVTLIVVDDIKPKSNGSGGFENYSFQMNCYSPNPPSNPDHFSVQQYGFRMANNQLFFWANDFRSIDAGTGPFVNWDSRSSSDVITLSNNVLPAGWQLTTTLNTDATSQNVIGFSFSVTGDNGEVLLATKTFTISGIKSGAGGDEAAINSFAPVLVGENGGAHTDFASGKAIFLCSADNKLAVTNSRPSFDDGQITVETSNITYAAMPASYPNGEFYQPFGIGSV